MKCPKCNYVSHDYLDACRKCGIDLANFKREVGLAVLQPGSMDLSLVFGDLGTDDLFAGMDEEVTMHAGDNDDFDISLDDHLASPAGRRGSFGIVSPGRQPPGDDISGVDHLTLELDALDMPPALAAHLRGPRTPPEGVPLPPAPVVPASLRPGAITLPGHLTMEMEAGVPSVQLPTSLFQEPPAPSPTSAQNAPKVMTTSRPPTESLELDLSQMTLPAGMTQGPSESHRTSSQAPQESAEATQDSSGSLPSLPMSDVVLADDSTAVIPGAQGSGEFREPTLATDDLSALTKTLDDLQNPHVPSGPAVESDDDTSDVYELSLDESNASISTSPPHTPSSREPFLETTDLVPSFEFEIDGLPPREEAPLSAADEARSLWPLTAGPAFVPQPRSAMDEEETLTPSDIFALGRLGEAEPTGHLTIELYPADLPADVDERLLDEATRTASHLPSTGELLAGADLDTASSSHESLIQSGYSTDEHSGRLTLELNVSQPEAEDVSALIINTLQHDSAARSTTASTPPSTPADDDLDELLFDLGPLTPDEDTRS